MAQYDGHILIDTSISSTNFNKGVSGIMNSLKGIAAAVGIAFGVAAIIRFGKACAEAASALQIMENRFRAVFGAEANYATQQLIALSKKINMADDDLMSLAATLQNTAIALGFTGMGAADLSLQLTALTEDLATFFDVTDVEMAQTLMMAMQGMTRGLKRLGISITEADIKNKALTLGLYSGAGALSATAQASAILALIVDKTTAAQGNAAKTAHGWAGEIRGLKGAWDNFKQALGGAVIIFAPVIAMIHSLINWLTVLAQYFAMVVAALFGIKVDVGGVTGAIDDSVGAADDLSDGMGDVGEKTKAAGKAAKGALAAFDELNVLQQAEPGGGGGGGGGAIVVPPVKIPPPDTSALDKMKAKVAEFIAALKAFFAPLKEPLERLGEAFKRLGATIWAGLQWVWFNILVPLGTWLVQKLAPVFIDLLTAAVNLLNTALIALAPLGVWLWENFLKPIAEWTGGAIITILKWLTDELNKLSAWIEKNPEKFRTIAIIIGILAGAIWLVIRAVELYNLILAISAIVSYAFGIAIAFLTSPIGLVILAIIALIAIIILCIKYWPQITTAAQTAWNNLTTGATAFWEGFKLLAKTAINMIISLINAMIRAFVGGINGAIGALNSLKINIPSWVPGLGGKSWGISIPTVTAPQIPLLAKGAVIPPHANMLAMLGEGSRREIVAPEDTIRRIITEVLDGRDGGGNMTVTMPVYLDGEKIYENQKRIQWRRGNSLINGVTG